MYDLSSRFRLVCNLPYTSNAGFLSFLSLFLLQIVIVYTQLRTFSQVEIELKCTLERLDT